jgi:molecular chaperone IbpA
MRTYDLPALRRSTVGFDRLLNLVNDATIEHDNYPPFDVERTGENNYLISLALPGFTPEEIAITAEQSGLTVEGRKAGNDSHDYLHHEITVRPFRRVFNLAEYGEGRELREWHAQDRFGPGSAGGNEAAPHSDRECGRP